MTPIGLALVASGIACFIVLGRFILPKGSADDAEEKPQSSLENTLKEIGETYEIQTRPDFTDYREPVLVDDLRRRYLVNVLAMTEPPDFKTLSPTGDQAVRSDVHLLVYGRKKDVLRMVEEEEMHLKEAPKIFKGETEDGASGTVEAVVAPPFSIGGKNPSRYQSAGSIPGCSFGHLSGRGDLSGGNRRHCPFRGGCRPDSR